MGLLQNVGTRAGIHRTPTGRRLGLTNQQMGVLDALIRNPGCTVSEVAESCFLGAPTVSRFLRSLESKKWVVRRREKTDQRVVRLNATGKGARVLNEVHTEAEEIVGLVLQRLSNTEQEAVLVGLRALVDALGNLEDDP